MLGSERQETLQRYFDGELSAEEREVVRRELESDAEGRAALAELERLHELIGAHAETMGASVDSDALFARIEAKLALEEADDDPLFPGALREDDDLAESIERAPMAPAPAAPAEAAPTEAAPASPPRLRAIEGGRSARVWAPVAAGLAIAAAVLLFVMRGDPPTDPSGIDDARPIADATPPAGSEILEVDFGYSTGAVFSVTDDGGEQYAVLWISDETPEEEERL